MRRKNKNRKNTSSVPVKTSSDKVYGYKTNIGDFMLHHHICIPMLQRDYAQGREGKEYIRERLLKEVLKSTTDNYQITLDFIYGNSDSAEKNRFYPLDGQQRLTTIWLVYWYLAVRSGKLNEEKDNLIKLSYETRKSSREFCKCLCEKLGDLKIDHGLVNCLKEQTWFFAEWKTDPTINSMLRTLGGTTSEDGIEPLFGNIATNKNKWGRYLNNFKQNISFYVLNIEGKILPEETADQLYVKMNARGRALTDFENFKADLVADLKTNKYSENKIDEEDLYLYVPRKIDVDWNDIFWKNSSAGKTDGKTDEIFFAFINRFCLNQLFVKKESNDNYSLKEQYIRFIDDIRNSDTSSAVAESKIKDASEDEKQELLRYDYLYNDHNLTYEKYDYYDGLLTFDNIKKLDNVFSGIGNHLNEIQDVLNNICKIVAIREQTKYIFLPQYKLDEKGIKKYKKDKAGNCAGEIEKIEQKERVYFYAVCKFFEEGVKFNIKAFQEWMRIVRNIVENSGIGSVITMISCIRLINELGTHSHTILSYLASPSISKPRPSTKMNIQMLEEIQKAKRMAVSVIDKAKIIEAEKFGFLCGRIRFLFTDKNGNEDWVNFDNRYATVNSCFLGNTVSTTFVKDFVGMYLDFDDIQDTLVFHNKGWQNRGDCWLDILCGQEYEKVDNILQKKNICKSSGNLKSFINSNTFNDVVEKRDLLIGQQDLRIARRGKTWSLYKKNAQGGKLYFDNGVFERGSLLSSLSKATGFEICENQRICGAENYYWGEDISFIYNNQNYLWTYEDDIFMCDEKWKKKVIKVKGASTITYSSILAML